MESRDEILQMIEAYRNHFPDEKERTELIYAFVKAHEGTQLIDRKNFTGHITASAFILNQEGDKLLLLKHKFLEKWLQPGGHVDAADQSLLFAALREASEETGLGEHQLQPFSSKVFDFDSHRIPENVKKQELPHYHHDLRFLFRTKDDSININTDESTGSRWVDFAELQNNQEFARLVPKIVSLRER